MPSANDVVLVLQEILQINQPLTPETELLGGLPEFDSMAVVTVLTAFEEQFGITVDDDEVDASIFETVGTLVDFVNAKS